MDILGLMSVLSFGLTCFGIGYSFGKDNSNEKNSRACLINEAAISIILWG